MTSREIALEASVRFTDRSKYTIEDMLRHAERIEKWLERDLPTANVPKPQSLSDQEWEAIKGKMRDAETKKEY